MSTAMYYILGMLCGAAVMYTIDAAREYFYEKKYGAEEDYYDDEED